ncbi:hypothetical protein LTR05_002719 [Lithohypha guttulata]|uniref:Glycosyl hydrolase n=1 Tax=Lithohypha guttulata TaxID=1690604 RepID=A0AAN7YCI7_9EURO|nr:hypothetical protein LTR05_002719 [Lithohypha guttulata]
MTAAIGPTWRGNLVAANAWSSSHGLSHIGDGQHVGFINDFYDDEGWWALAWIAVYDLNHDSKYLDQAVTIFNDLEAAWNSTPVGGLWWNKKHEYVNAITNELYFSIAAHLANRCPDDRERYINSAQAAWRWLFSSGIFTSQRNVKDGLAVGSNPGATEIVWSYNQGVVLSALTELSAATFQDLYIGIAKLIADAALANLTSADGNEDAVATLRDPCEAEMWCGIDGATFKGVFARNLAHLHSVSPEDRYAEFLRNNADALWTRSRDQYNRLGLVCGGPFTEPAGASTRTTNWLSKYMDKRINGSNKDRSEA